MENVVVELRQLRQLRRLEKMAVGYGYTESRHSVAVAIDLRYAGHIRDALDRGHHPIVVVERWAVLDGHR